MGGIPESNTVSSQSSRLGPFIHPAVVLFFSWTLYPLGDAIAQAITGEFSTGRLVALALAGGLLYHFEVQRWFAFLAQKQFEAEGIATSLKPLVGPYNRLNGLGRTVGAIAYFNPLWIARHMLIIELGVAAGAGWFTLDWRSVVFGSLLLGFKSFFVNLPVSLVGNAVLQGWVPLAYRYYGSIVLTGLFAIVYALCYRFL